MNPTDPDEEMTYRLANEHPHLMERLSAALAAKEAAEAEVAKLQEAMATLYGAFEEAAEARDHAVAQVLIQNGETSRAANEAGLEQQRAERAEAQLDALREPVGMRSDGTADPRVEAGADALTACGVPRQAAWDYAHVVLVAAVTPPEPTPEAKPKACEGFRWIGQSLAHCDGCGEPFWEHTHDRQIRADAGPFDRDPWVLVPITPERAAAARRRYCPTCSGPSRETVGMVCQTCGTDYGSVAGHGGMHSPNREA